MTERENALLVYHHQKPQWTPNMLEAIYFTGFFSHNECGMRGERIKENIAVDCFGVEWIMDHGSPVPNPGKYILDDISNWRTLKFPEPKTYDWEAFAKVELADYDGTKLLTYFCEQGLFDRLTQLMGFENALMALLENPEECMAFFERMVQYKIELIECVAKYYKPDVFMYTDDIAKSDSLFMSPATYQEVIKPYHARIIQAIKDNGMIAEQHTCGKYDAVVDDYVEIGIQSLFPTQASNDIVSIQKKHGDKAIVFGGFNSQGPCGYVDADEATMREEARRMADTYAVNGNFIACPMIGDLFSPPTPQRLMQIGSFCDEFRKRCNELGI